MMYQQSASDIHTAFLKGEVTASSIANYYIQRIQTMDSDVQAFLDIHADRFMEKAAELDLKKAASDKPLGKLAGVPIAIKDNIHMQGCITTCGSKFLSNYTAPFDASVVKFIEEQDGLIIGKTNLDEFAMGSSTEHSAYQITRNPWNLSLSPGGSSGGSAAAVSARLAPLALGSDTGGSIRQPAAFTGTVGYKPTYGTVSRYGLVAFGSSLDQIGPFANCVKDIAMIMEVLAQPCHRDATHIGNTSSNYLDHLKTSIQGKSIGIPWSLLETLNANTLKQFKKDLDILKALGATIVPIDLEPLKHAIPTYYILSTAEASTNLARFDGVRFGKRSEQAKTIEDIYYLSRKEGFGKEVKQRILLGSFVLSSGYQDAYYKQGQKIRSLIIQSYQQAFRQCDTIAMPVTPTPPFEIGAISSPIEEYMQDLYTVGANLAGLPAISVPSGTDSDHLPTALQFLAPQMDDLTVMMFASQFEKAVNLQNFIPPLFDKESFV